VVPATILSALVVLVSTAAPSRDESPLVFRVYGVQMLPTTEAECLGAVPLDDSLQLQAGKLCSTDYTGRGCVVGRYSRVTHHEIRYVIGGVRFRLRAVDPSMPDASVEWTGTIRGAVIDGEVRFVTPGTATAREEIERAVAALWESRYKPKLFFVDGRAVNVEILEQCFQYEAAQLRNRLLLPGNELRYVLRGSLKGVAVEAPRGPRRPYVP
jgi:hypothetical protein